MAASTGALFALLLMYNLYSSDAAPKSKYVGIVGGQRTRIEDFPFQLSLRIMGKHVCGAMLIHEKFILTAAHCSIVSASYYSILAGTDDLEHGGQSYDVETVIDHPDYVAYANGDYDLTIMKLKQTVALSDKVAIGKLSTMNGKFPKDTIFNITGWGDTEYEGESSRILLRSYVPFVGRKKCTEVYAGITEVNRHMLCAGSEGHDACQGDSGGPLSLHGEIVGVVSRGKYCAHKEYPTIYTRVSKFRGWIQKTIDDNL